VIIKPKQKKTVIEGHGSGEYSVPFNVDAFLFFQVFLDKIPIHYNVLILSGSLNRIES